MNLIPVIREALGLKVNEEFQILKNDGTTYALNYRFADNNKLQWFDSDKDCWKSSSSITLEKIIYGQVAIKKLPFRPEEGELYYLVGFYTGDVISTCYAKECQSDIVNVKGGNCYRTEEEAEKHVDEWMSKVYGENWKELLK